ncbi:hypothetical protein NBRC110019_29510 [Neptunitalea chrysea]|uniref:DUF1508 domain-containing protein n=1 Tax=Neptunitalea chrysea TaxID=1647581 RepID=A0A9W6B8S3_9FLAO|nr:DUF1508 domain-containing protein [Neptunitalea chrysea]GLB53910.1 hypothetical protein NBRC110019_29510 [Neptunitalea chrysea]
MSVFLINKRYNGSYKFVFTNRKGHTVFTSISCREKEHCEKLVNRFKASVDMFDFIKIKTPAGKLYFQIAIDEQVLATSRKFSTELSMEKGISNILKYIPEAEMLEMPGEEDIF